MKYSYQCFAAFDAWYVRRKEMSEFELKWHTAVPPHSLREMAERSISLCFPKKTVLREEASVWIEY